MLRFNLEFGTSTGQLPPQRIFSLESRLSGVAQFGTLYGSDVKEFRGDKYVTFNLEHNFRNLPFILLGIPFLYKHNIEFTTHASFAQMWKGAAPVIPDWYSEAGIGLSRILDFLRADVTYRITEPKRFVFTLGIATWL
jgi:hypothetical protein